MSSRIRVTFALLVLAVYVLLSRFVLHPIDRMSAVARKVSEVTGRPFAINGDVSVHLSRHPRIVARDVVLGNAPWSEEPEMARVGAVEFTLDALALLQRRIVVPQLTVSDARVVLERNADGDGADLARKITSTVDNLAAVVSEITAFGRTPELKRAPTDLGALIEE